MAARAFQGCWQPITFCTVCRACGPDRGPLTTIYACTHMHGVISRGQTCVGGGAAVRHATCLLTRYYVESERCLEAGRVLTW